MHYRWVSIFPLFPLGFRFFIFIYLLFLIQKSQNSRHKLHDRKYTVSSFPKKLVNGKIHDLGVVLYVSCLTFQFSSFFPVHKSAENNTRSSSCACSPQVLVWAWRVTQRTATHMHTKRQLASLVSYSCWNLERTKQKKNSKFDISCANPIPTLGLFFFFH